MNTQSCMLLVNFLNSIGNLAAQTQTPFQALLHYQSDIAKERVFAIEMIENINRAIEMGLDRFENLSSEQKRNNVLRLVAPSEGLDPDRPI